MPGPRAARRTDDRDGYPPPGLTAAVLALLTIVLALVAAIAIGETSSRAFASYTPIAATVVDEHSEERLVADRRGSSREPFRVVTVELPDGTSADVRSDDLVVGATVTVYRSDARAVFETPPVRPGLLEWALCAATAAAAMGLAIITVRCLLRLRVPSSPR